MKTVSKKLFSLLLVAVLLVCALPFQAMATETVEKKIYFYSSEYGVDEKTGQTLVDYASVVDSTGIPSFTKDGKANVAWTIVGADGQTVSTNNIASDIAGANIPWKTKDGIAYTYVAAYAVYPTPQVHEHSYNAVVTAPTCTVGGYTTHTCECGESYTDSAVAALGHNWGAWEVTTPATTTSTGVETRECSVCHTKETRDIAKAKVTVTFSASDHTGQSWDYDWELYSTVTFLPTPNKVVGKQFVGWYNIDGGKLEVGDKWDGEYSYYEAKYQNGEDGLSTLSVYVRCYVDGVQQGSTIHLYDHVFNDGDNILNWLQKNETTTYTAIFNEVDADKYEWLTPYYYYDYSGSEPLSSQDLIANGNKSIVVKVHAKDTATANVLLYVHNSLSSTPAAIYEMKGYTSGNTVTLAAAKSLIKDKTGKTYTVDGLYTDSAWTQKINGQKPTAANGELVPNNGTLKLHVLVSNYTATTVNPGKSTGDNPATGDMIGAAVAAMSLSGAAFVTLTQLRKRKMF